LTIDNRKVLIALSIFSLCLIPINIFAEGLLHIILVLPLVLFIPGYTFLAALFPGNSNLTSLTRIALSFGMSISVVPLIGLIMNYSPWGVTPDSVVVATVLFVCTTSIAGFIRFHRLLQTQRLYFKPRLRFPAIASMSRTHKALSVLLVVTILCFLGCLSYVLVTPTEGELFTEFYILGHDRTAINYPTEITAGVPAQVTLGIINHEARPAKYRVVLKMNNEIIGQQLIDLLHDGEKWETTTSFTPHTIGTNRRVEFYLYRDEESSPYFKDPLWLQVNVIAPK
jgi:uncharacterized membrane protein